MPVRSIAAGKCFLDMLGVFAEFETNLRPERELENIAKAKAAGVCRGRPTSIHPAKLPAGMSTRCVFFDCFKN
jgi:DNA invertase Pin-like site-specific DNA recombinase